MEEIASAMNLDHLDMATINKVLDKVRSTIDFDHLDLAVMNEIPAKVLSAMDFDHMDNGVAIRSMLDSDHRIRDRIVAKCSSFLNNYNYLERLAAEMMPPAFRHCFQGKKDNRIIEVVRHATYKSIELVIQKLREPNAHRSFSAKTTTKSLCRSVLAHFDLVCNDFQIANNSDATHLRSCILMASELAEQYIRQQNDQIQFPEDDIDFDSFILQNLSHLIIGESRSEDTGSNMQYATQSLDGDLVGLGGDLREIEERLTGPLQKLEIIPIVGMGGIGKTTLTRRVYEDHQIISNFHVRAWTVASQEYNERNVLLGLLQSIAPLPEEVLKEDKEKLAERLYRRLKGWRYFIVIDDIWTIEAWDRIKLCFPDDSNGSRIVLTTRVTDVATHVNSENPPHFMNLLGPEESWDLLRTQVYGKEACPSQLVSVGKHIAEKCQGLPLAIKVVAGHLSNIGKMQESWEDVANIVGMPREVTQMDSLFNILSMSYNNLPHHLKACFLSMVTFPKNSEMSTRKLIKLWSAMGFLPPKLPNSVEEVAKEVVAMKCFDDLVGRNLIMVKKRRFDGQVKLCGIHDLLWDLSMREVRKEGNFIFGETSLCHSYFNTSDGMKYAMNLTHTLFYFDQSFELDCPLNSAGFEILRVLDILNQSFDDFPNEITYLVNLRYLALATCGNIPDAVSKLCYLETLINNHERAGSILPKEIWLLACLRHLQIGTCAYLAEPTIAENEGISRVLALQDLQTISNLSITSCTKEVFLKMPKLKKLGILETGEEDKEDELLISSLNNIVHLHQLENLKLCCNSKLKRPRCIPDWNSFLTNIKQLTLIRSNLLWSEMKDLAMLQNLEVLKLKDFAFKGHKWEMEDEEFLHLKFLLLESLDLVNWNAEADNFPALRRLVIRDCPSLFNIPKGLGQISTLQLIDLEYYNGMVTNFSEEIQSEQKDMGNDKFILHIGRMMPEQHVASIAFAFVYMTWQLKMSWANTDRRKWKGKDTVRNGEVHDECSSDSSSAEPSNYRDYRELNRKVVDDECSSDSLAEEPGLLAWSLVLIACGGILWLLWKGK